MIEMCQTPQASKVGCHESRGVLLRSYKLRRSSIIVRLPGLVRCRLSEISTLALSVMPCQDLPSLPYHKGVWNSGEDLFSSFQSLSTYIGGVYD
jgi:hypothetical protein